MVARRIELVLPRLKFFPWLAGDRENPGPPPFENLKDIHRSARTVKTAVRECIEELPALSG